MQHVVRLLSTLALKGALHRLTGQYQAAAATRIDADFAPTLGLLQRLRNGETADIVILTKEGLEELVAEGAVVAESKVELARSYVCIAVKAGGGHPDIATEQALRKALLAARSVAYSQIGASGIFFAGLITRLGIADLQTPAVFSAGRTTASKQAAQADAFLAFLASKEVAPVLRESGLEP